MRSPRSALVAAVATTAAATALGATPARAASNDTWPVPPSASIVIAGHGYGHGHGLSQYGAEGAAAQGLSWQQIVRFYYPGTRLATAHGTIRVLITEDTSRDVVVDPQRDLVLRRLDATRHERSTWRLDQVRPAATRWRILPRRGRSQIEYRLPGQSTRWHRWASFPGEAEFGAGRLPLTLHLPDKTTVSYRGALRSAGRATVDVVSLDRYVMGVVPSEVFPTWPQAALRAQAVAARTYAAYERAHAASSTYDICDTPACQVYGGAGVEQDSTNQAARRTAGRVLDYDGSPAFTQFSSSNGGWTSAGSEPYLVAQQDPYEASSDNPNASWSVTLSDQDVEKAFPQLGDLTSITFSDRDGHGEWGGRVGTVVLTGSGGSLSMTGDDFRSALDLRSTWMTVATVSTAEAARHVFARHVFARHVFDWVLGRAPAP